MASANQPSIEGTEDDFNKKIHSAAVRYAKARDERIEAGREESLLHDALILAMKAEGMDTYQHGTISVRIDLSEKAKVKDGSEVKGDEK